MKALFIEGLLVAVGGMLISLAANQVSPYGLQLTRDYFRVVNNSTNRPTVGQQASPGRDSQSPEVIERLRQKGLQHIDSQPAFKLFQDPRYQQSLVLFIDARDDMHYEAGHIPGAYQLDYYRPEKYLQTVLPACQVAEQIVVYCNGGDCEDSELTASLLRDSGIGADKLFVYTGGITDWGTNGFPIEKGTRLSGILLPSTKTKP